MRLLVTRPQPEADALARRLTGLGHTVLVQPLITIALAPEPDGLAQQAAIAITSGNAVKALAAWPHVGAWKGATVYAVGSATAAAARSAGFRDVRNASGDVAALAAFIRADFAPQRGAILYAAARDRAADLAALLPGFPVTTVEAYRAEAAAVLDRPIADALRAQTIDGVLLFSRRSAEIFVGLAAREVPREALGRLVLYALSQQVAEPLATLLPTRVAVAPHPNEESLLTLLDPALIQHR